MSSIIDKQSFFTPIRNHFNKKLQKIRENIIEHMSSRKMDAILELLLRAMKIFFFISGEYRKNISGFNGKIAFTTEDGGLHSTAVFRRSRVTTRYVMDVKDTALKNVNVKITFKNGQAMARFLLAPSPDILRGILESQLSVTGNVNYILRFVYLAVHIPVYLGIQDILES